MNFASDNWSGVAPQIQASLAEHANGAAAAYGNSELDGRVKEQFSELFEKEVSVFFVGTGTIANSLAMGLYSKPGGLSFCHREAHMMEDECGAPEFFSSGVRLVGIDGAAGRMDFDDLRQKVDRIDADFVHYGQGCAVSVTQATEAGTIYSLDEIRTITEFARSRSLPVHMDGSRFANALVNLDVTPAEMTWKSGIDILSFGGTKNGCWCAEAIVVFDPQQAAQLAYFHKRSGQLFSKSRFISAQYEAYLKGGLWLDLARSANQSADLLRQGINDLPNARLGWETQSNEVFCILPEERVLELQKQNVQFYEWHVPTTIDSRPSEGEKLYRLVTSFATTDEEIRQFIDAIK